MIEDAFSLPTLIFNHAFNQEYFMWVSSWQKYFEYETKFLGALIPGRLFLCCLLESHFQT